MTAKKKSETPAPKPASSPQKAAYDLWVRQSSSQWDTLLRNPMFLKSMATSFDSLMTVAGRFRDIVGLSLRTMNLPTREDLAAFHRRLDDIQERLDDISERLERLEAPPRAVAPKKRTPAPRKATVRTVKTTASVAQSAVTSPAKKSARKSHTA
jgi:BMFP domain-containing protein YqiC